MGRICNLVIDGGQVTDSWREQLSPPPRGGYLVHVWATLDFMTLFRTKDKIYLVEVLLGRQSSNYTLFRNSDVISHC